MNKLITCILICLSSIAWSQTPETWSLEQCINIAIEKNITIQQNILQGDIAENNLQAAKLNRYPTLNASGNHNYNIGRTIDPFTNTFSNQTIQSNSFSLSAGVLIYGGNQVNNSIKQNQVMQQSNAAGTEVITNQISLAVANTYLQIVQAEENLKIAEAQKELTKSQLERGKKLVENGAANQSTILSLEAQLANDQVNIINAQNAIQLGYNSLVNLLQVDFDTDFRIEMIDISTLPEMPTDNVANLYELALGNLPEIKQAELNVQQSELSQKIASASLQPTVSAYGNINTVYSESGQIVTQNGFDIIPIGVTQTSNEIVLGQSPNFSYQQKGFGNQLSDNLGQQVGVSLSVPIFNGYRAQTNLENAKLNTQISDLNLQNTKNQLRADITTAYTNLKSSKARYDAAVASEEAQRKNFEFSQARFDAGMMNSVDLLNAKTFGSSLK